MRFHFGVSFSWKQIKKIIIPILIAIGLYFGLTANVSALSYTLPITGGGGGLTYTDGTSGGQNSWCTQTVNSTEYVFRCGGLYDDTFSAGQSIYGEGNNLLNYSTQWFANTGSLCDTTQTAIEFFIYAYPFETDALGRSYDFFDYYDIVSIAYPSSASSTCTYSKVQKNMLKVNCVYNTGSAVQFNMYGRLKDVEPPYINSFKMFIKRNINYTCNATNQDIDNSINSGFNNLNNAVTNGFNQLNQDMQDALTSNNEKLEDIEGAITDDTVNTDNADNFFNNFEEKDFGLSDIVKAPLVLIQGLSNGSSCQDLQFSVFDTDVSMPSGCILWDKVPDNIEAIYYIFIGGFLAYILGTKLFHDVNDLKDPQKNEVSTLDL